MPNREPKEKGAIASGSAQIHYKSMTGLKEEEEKKKSSTNSTKKRKSIANIFVKSLAKKRIYVIFFEFWDVDIV